MLRAASALLLMAAAPLAAQPVNPQIDYPGYQRLAREVQPYRQTHLVDFAAFSRAWRGSPGVLILDARSAERVRGRAILRARSICRCPISRPRAWPR